MKTNAPGDLFVSNSDHFIYLFLTQCNQQNSRTCINIKADNPVAKPSVLRSVSRSSHLPQCLCVLLVFHHAFIIRGRYGLLPSWPPYWRRRPNFTPRNLTTSTLKASCEMKSSSITTSSASWTRDPAPARDVFSKIYCLMH
ncbi:unnamed protein product [Bemisia tabaci]|uniref:Uncharacterized protein n=1 Tax=Bemisia tabaci TaxID=7038 RepID=A0A9P0CEL5_BEMTA|nr:unnamed protein product [Bemisia tabaci]